MLEEKSGIAALISGTGSTMYSVAEACKIGVIPTKVVCVVSSDPNAEGIEKAKNLGLPVEIVDEKSPWFSEDLSDAIKPYKPKIIAQLGWLPRTPDGFLIKHPGEVFNQHMGPGGAGMMGVRRVFAHQRFNEVTGSNKSFPIFCHRVDPYKEYDEGEAVFIAWWNLGLDEDVYEAHERLKKVEHLVQIESYRRIITGDFTYQPVPNYTQTLDEVNLMNQIRLEARKKYPRSML